MAAAPVTLYLIWTLVNGEVYDANAFTKLEGDAGCTSMLATWQSNLAEAARQREDLRAVQFVGCQPVEVDPPATPEPRRETM